MDDFIFGGEALRGYGAHAFLGKAATIGGGMERAQYDAGGEEPLDLGDGRAKGYKQNVTLVPLSGERATDEWQRRLMRWLRGRRALLCLERTPDRGHLAQFDADWRLSWSTWPLGALETSATMSGASYASRESRASIRCDTSGVLTIGYDTGEPRPPRIEIAPESGSVIRAVTICAGGGRVAMDGLAAARRIVIDQAADLALAQADDLMAFGHVTRWDQLSVASGEPVTIEMDYDSGSSARVTASVRGRWPV